MRRRGSGVVVGGAALVLTIVASGTAWASPPTSRVPASTAHRAPVRAGNVADSFGSGEGGIETGPYAPGSDTATDKCHRSATSPARLVERTGLIRVAVDASCSGATTTNVTTTGQYGEPPQAEQLDPGLGLVYVIIGGNDINFGTLSACFIQTDCDKTPIPAASMQLISVLAPKLDAAYNAVRAHAPAARVIVELYPRLLPAVGAPVGPFCPEFDTAEIALGNQVQTQLNAVIAERARAHGFRVADPAPFFVRHDLCSTSSFFYQPGAVPPAATFHPNLSGRVGLAIAAGLTSI